MTKEKVKEILKRWTYYEHDGWTINVTMLECMMMQGR